MERLDYSKITNKYTAAEFMELTEVLMAFDTYCNSKGMSKPTHQDFWSFLKQSCDRDGVKKYLRLNFIAKYDDSGIIHSTIKDLAIPLSLNNSDIPAFCDFSGIIPHLDDLYTSQDLKRIVEQKNTKSMLINGADDLESIYDDEETFSTMFNAIDDLFGGGIEFGTVMIMSGDNGSGKSTLANQVFINNAIAQADKQYKPCLFSGELTHKMVRKWVSQTFASEEHLEEYREGLFRAKREAMPYIKELMKNFLIMDLENNYSIATIVAQMNKALEFGSKIFVIDNLLMIEDYEKDYLQKQKNIVKTLKDFAKKHNVIVVLVAHNNKPTKGVTYRASKHDISGSSNITNLADYVVIIDRKPDVGDFTNLSVFSLLKNRPVGKTGEIGLHLNRKKRRYGTLKVQFNNEINNYEFSFNTLSTSIINYPYYRK